MNRRASSRRRLALGVALALGLAGGLGAYGRARGRSVAVLPVRRAELVQTVVATGRVAALARVELAALAPGVVTQVAVREGDAVAAGQVLLRLRSGEARAGVEQAEAAVDRSRAAELSAEAAVRQARSAVARAEASLERLERVEGPAGERSVAAALAEKELADRRYERAEGLFRVGVSSRSDLDEASRAARVAAERHAQESILAQSARPGGSGYREALAGLQEARAAEEVARAGAREAGARRREAEAARRAAGARLEDLLLRAPSAGRVVLRQVEVGDAVQPGPTLLALSVPGRTEVHCSLDEKNLPYVRAGQPARVSADAYPQAPFDGRVATVVPAVAAATGTVTVRIAVPEPPPFLLPDMTVSAEIETARRAGVLVLPADAVRDLFGAPWVLVARDGVARRAPLALGVRGRDRVEVLGGLGEGDLVLGAAETSVAEGDRVRPARRP